MHLTITRHFLSAAKLSRRGPLTVHSQQSEHLQVEFGRAPNGNCVARKESVNLVVVFERNAREVPFCIRSLSGPLLRVYA